MCGDCGEAVLGVLRAKSARIGAEMIAQKSSGHGGLCRFLASACSTGTGKISLGPAAELFLSPFTTTLDFLTFLHRSLLLETKRFKVDDFRHFQTMKNRFLSV